VNSEMTDMLSLVPMYIIACNGMYEIGDHRFKRDVSATMSRVL